MQKKKKKKSLIFFNNPSSICSWITNGTDKSSQNTTIYLLHRSAACDHVADRWSKYTVVFWLDLSAFLCKISDHDYVPVNVFFLFHKQQEFLNSDYKFNPLASRFNYQQSDFEKDILFASHLTAITLKSASDDLYNALQQLFIVSRA